MRACVKIVLPVLLVILIGALSPAIVSAAGDAHGGGLSSSLSAEKLQDLFWRTVNFLALVVILVKFGAKPIMGSLSGRQQQIREELEDLTVRRDEAERSYKEFEAKLAGMEKEMELIVERAIAQAQVEKERILADAAKAADDIIKAMQKRKQVIYTASIWRWIMLAIQHTPSFIFRRLSF